MKTVRNASIALILTGSVLLTGCTSVIGPRVDPGYVGFLVPNYGDNAGIEGAKIYTGGRVPYNSLSNSWYEFPIVYRTVKFEGENQVTFSLAGSSGQLPLAVTYRYSIAPVDEKKPEWTKLHQLFEQYRLDPEALEQGTMQTALRDCTNFAAAQTTNPVTIATNPTLITEGIKKCLENKLPELDIKEISLTGNIQLPPALKESIDRAVQANQDADTALANATKAEAEGRATAAQATAEANALVIKAKGEAEANRILSESLTPELIELRRVERWNGEMPPSIQTNSAQVSQSGILPDQR